MLEMNESTFYYGLLEGGFNFDDVKRAIEGAVELD